MNEYRFEASEQRRRQNVPPKSEKQPVKTNSLLNVLTMQAIVCVVMAIFLILTHTFFPTAWSAVRRRYVAMASQQVEVTGVFKSIKQKAEGFFSSFKPLPANSSKPAVNSATPSTGSGNNTTSTGAQNSSHTESVSSKDNAISVTSKGVTSDVSSQTTSSSSATGSGVVTSTTADKGSDASKSGKTLAANPLGAGGEENPVKMVNGHMLPPDNATFAPVFCTAKITVPLSSYSPSDGFGYRIHPISKEMDFHTALDLAAPAGTPIHAALSGTVTRAESSATLGNFIEIDHGNGVVTRYGHCSELIAQKGMVVRQGEVIAKVGSTGVSTGNHVHFAIIIDGKYVDPSWIMPHD